MQFSPFTTPAPASRDTSFAIYHNTPQHPGLYVVRTFRFIDGRPAPSQPEQTAPTLDAARLLLPANQGLIPVRRIPGDHPHLVEAWV